MFGSFVFLLYFCGVRKEKLTDRQDKNNLKIFAQIFGSLKKNAYLCNTIRNNNINIGIMKGKLIIGLFACVWVAILVYITFYSTNEYINTMVFFGGAMLTVCGFAYGCEEMEKKQIKK